MGVPAAVPQGTKLGPWLFVIMVNELDIPNSELWRYVDDTSMAETISKGGSSTIQNDVDELINQSVLNKFQMNEGKCKEMRIGFSKLTTHFVPIKIDNNPLELVKCAKILGLTVSNDLNRGETRALIGGSEYSYIRVLPDEFLLKLTLMTADFKRNSSGRTRRYEYSPAN